MAQSAPSSDAFEPLITAFVCNWCTYTGADLAGTSRLEMPTSVRIVRLPCTGRIDPLFLIKAFERGADGVIVSGCHPDDCHYTSGNFHARRRFAIFRELMHSIGIHPDRVFFSWVSASEGGKWQQVVEQATTRVRELGPFHEYRALVAGNADGKVDFALPSPEAVELGDGRGEPWQVAAEAELRATAAEILSDGRADVIIGWEQGPRGVRPTFVANAEDADKLVFDRRCEANLAAFLGPRRTHLERLGKPAVVVKGCDARAVAGLIRERQLEREDVVIIGVQCGGMATGDGRAAERCSGCDVRTPTLVDHLVGELPPEPPRTTARSDLLAALDAASPAERWAFWQGELARCVRCHACRSVCALCTCGRCVADKTRPQWIESSPHGRGNLSWHLNRALHLAGRCADCGECQRACPVAIPLALLNAKVAEVVDRRFQHRVVDDPTVGSPIGTFERSDSQEFIL
jgi:coenzyme F420-reducing hydrogenase delta subunit